MSLDERLKSTLLSRCMQPGLQAISEKSKIKSVLPINIKRSVNIDACLQDRFPRDPRWDYLIIYTESEEITFFVEIHEAKDSEVERVIKKVQWVRGFLEDQGINLRDYFHEFHWLSSNGVHMSPNSLLAKKLARYGISGPKSFLWLAIKKK
ncbi:MAG TPA: hypothetical protein PLP59_10300 [Thermotogota bacterium]|nr:hypothetical protein [Thermotogota bacterium]HPB87902.1 hypothetical protein [Thermotogota bacterium]HQQ66794.1 hypothetical protein [Thermotogota bacterium]